jgi:uncharacterized protein (DUF2141 family)
VGDDPAETRSRKEKNMIGPIRRKLLLALLPVLCSAFFAAHRSSAQSPAPTPKTDKLIVKITGIRNAEGNIRVALRTGENTIVAAQIAEIDPKTLTAEIAFDNVAEGEYGVAVMHDENKNEKLDFNEVGMPLEGYGHSNNPAKRPGPPDFNETKFALAGPSTTITINLIYWP